MAIEQFAETLLEKIKGISRTDTVIGKPIESEQGTIIPVSKVSLGFGVGGNNDKAEIAASGAGASVVPMGFLVINQNGVQMIPISKEPGSIAKITDLIPEVIGTVLKEYKDHKKSKDPEEK